MRKSIGAGGRVLAAAIVALAESFAAGALAAAVEDPGELVPGARLYSSEVPDSRNVFRHDLWRFGEDGSVTAAYTIGVPMFDGTDVRTFRDSGTWRTADDSLCLRWRDLWAGQERCFQIVTAAGQQYGQHMYRATDVESGESWRFAIAR